MLKLLHRMIMMLLLFLRIGHAFACSSSTSRDSELITDPTFSFSVSPPVGWTYYPQVASGSSQTIANYFPGQSRTAEIATQTAQNEVMAAYLEAMSSSNYPVIGSQVQTTITYAPDEISNCYTGQAIPAGTKIGFLSGGAITEVALVSGTGGAGVTVNNCPLSETQTTTGIGPYEDYTKLVVVATKGGITMSRYYWERVASEMQSILNFRYRALFNSPIAID